MRLGSPIKFMAPSVAVQEVHAQVPAPRHSPNGLQWSAHKIGRGVWPVLHEAPELAAAACGVELAWGSHLLRGRHRLGVWSRPTSGAGVAVAAPDYKRRDGDEH